MGVLTTTDNPFDPRVSFDEWREWDEQAGYWTCNALARLTTAAGVPPEVEGYLIDEAMTIMVEENTIANYVILPDLEEDSVKNRNFPLENIK